MNGGHKEKKKCKTTNPILLNYRRNPLPLSNGLENYT